jgi:hypothetical protein
MHERQDGDCLIFEDGTERRAEPSSTLEGDADDDEGVPNGTRFVRDLRLGRMVNAGNKQEIKG